MAPGAKRRRGFPPAQEWAFSHSQTSVRSVWVKGSQKLGFLPFPFPLLCFTFLVSLYLPHVYVFPDGRTEAEGLALSFMDIYNI